MCVPFCVKPRLPCAPPHRCTYITNTLKRRLFDKRFQRFQRDLTTRPISANERKMWLPQRAKEHTHWLPWLLTFSLRYDGCCRGWRAQLRDGYGIAVCNTSSKRTAKRQTKRFSLCFPPSCPKERHTLHENRTATRRYDDEEDDRLVPKR